MSGTVILIGGPDTGKTNFLARLVAHLRDGKGALRATRLPDDIQYIEDALAHLMKGEFAPRSHNTADEVSGEIVIDVRFEEGAEEATIAVPDVSGETWDEVAKSAEISTAWLNRVQNAHGALLFVRVLSELNVAPMDWVNARDLLAIAGPAADFSLPTQVMLCEFLRLLEENLAVSKDAQVMLCEFLRLLEENLAVSKDARPRVAVMLTAFDRLDPETQKKGPMAFLESTFPLFAGRIANTAGIEIGVFGASVVGGELGDNEFKNQYLDGDVNESGYIVDGTKEPVERVRDISRPISWVLNYAIAP